MGRGHVEFLHSKKAVTISYRPWVPAPRLLLLTGDLAVENVAIGRPCVRHRNQLEMILIRAGIGEDFVS